MYKKYFLLLSLLFYVSSYAQSFDKVKVFFSKIFEKIVFDTLLNSPPPPIDTTGLSIGIYEPIPSDNPKYARDSLLRIQAYEASKNAKYDSVVNILNKISEPDSIDLGFLTKANIKLGKWDDALSTGQKIKTNNYRILTDIGIIAIVNKKNQLAIEEYLTKAVHLKPDYGRAYQYLGHAYFLEDEYNNAIENWKLAKKYVKSANYLDYFIGVAYFKLKNFSSAIKHFELVNKEQEEYYRYSIYYLSHIAFRNKDIQRANEILNRYRVFSYEFTDVELDLLKKQIYCNYILGINALENGESNKALDLFTKAEYLIGSHSMEPKKFSYITIIRGILIRLIEELRGDEKYEGSNLYFGKLITDLEYFNRNNHQFDHEIKTLGNIIYLYSENEEEKRLAARCYKTILPYDLAAENNYYCLYPDSISQIYIERLKTHVCSLNNLFLFYNISRIMYYRNMYQESYDFIQKFKRCIIAIDNFEYKNEFLIELLNLEIKIVNMLYKNNQVRVRTMVAKIHDQIAQIPSNNLKSIPEYIFINERNDFIVIFLI